MPDNPLVSVIVVQYNAEKTLGRALDSILAQSYKNIEVLLIDDGSTDGSPALCDEDARRDNRIRLIHQTNGGVSVARQKALDCATGVYLTHIDADDWVELDMIEKTVAAIEAEEADILLTDYYEVFKHTTRRCRQNPGKDRSAAVILRKLLNFNLMGFCCTKLYRTSVCRHVRYIPENLRFREDELFNARLLTHSPKIAYLPEAFYYYDKSESHPSLSRASKEKIYDTEKFLVSEYEKLVPFCATDPEDVSLLLRRKKEILYDAVFLKKYQDLTLFPEIHPTIKDGKNKDYWDHCLSLGLKGFPRLSHSLFRTGRWVFDLREKLRNR